MTEAHDPRDDMSRVRHRFHVVESYTSNTVTYPRFVAVQSWSHPKWSTFIILDWDNACDLFPGLVGHKDAILKRDVELMVYTEE